MVVVVVVVVVVLVEPEEPVADPVLEPLVEPVDELVASTLASPAKSQLAPPPYKLNAMPLTVDPAKPTELAGMVRSVHCPAAGIAPILKLPAEPLAP